MCSTDSLDPPPLLSAFLATAGDYRAVIVQAVIIILGILIYIPFVRINDKVLAKQAELENSKMQEE